ncbi:MAG TPA: PEP-CTERM sorting domain-containing protein [Phycisphaeraceae bacterium]
MFGQSHVGLIRCSLLGLFLIWGVSSASAVFTTSLESGEGYSVGTLGGQNDWANAFSQGDNSSRDAQVITSGTDGVNAVDGTQLGRVRRRDTIANNSHRATHALEGPDPLTTDFTVSAYLAYVPGDDGLINTAAMEVLDTASSFNGVRVGFANFSGTTRFMYRDGSAVTALQLGGVDAVVLVAGQMYLFVLDVHPATATYELNVYSTDNTLLGSASGAAARNGTNTFSYLGFMIVTDTGNSYDSVYFDSINQIVPEPASLGLLALGGLLLGRRRKGAA